MRIVFVSGHACIRVQKMAIPLVAIGHEVHLVARKIPSFPETYSTFCKYENQEQMLDAVKLHARAGAEVFHCHNEPSFFVLAVKEVSDRPVVLDVHDTFLTRSTSEEAIAAMDAGKRHIRVTAEERASFQLADGLVFVSEPVRQVACGEFGLCQPSIVLPSYVPRGLFRYQFGEWMGGLVYEGKVTLPGEHGEEGGTGFGYCDYSGVGQQTADLGMDFHLYAARDDEPFQKAFERNFVHPGLPYGKLLQAVSRHDWGLCGNLVDSPQWQQTLPNKLFDYMAAGVPSVAVNAGETSRVLEEHGIGITVGSIPELAERWAEHRECRARLVKHRQAYAMEEHIGGLLDLYGRLA